MKLLNYLWKIPLCALAFYGGTILGGMAATMMGFPAPEIPAGADQMMLGKYLFLTSLILAGIMAPLAHNLSGRFTTRWVTISLVIWIAYGINNILEGAIFTGISTDLLFTVVLYFFASFSFGAASAWLFPSKDRETTFAAEAKSFFGRHSWGSWGLRLLAAWIAFPIIYLAFGRLISPLVIDYYQQGLFGLSLPDWGQILPILFLRSFLFLIACLPILITWQGSKLKLFLVLSLTLYLLVGGLAMLQAYWMPTSLRVIHNLEILVDEIFYAGILVALLAKPDINKIEQ